MRPLLPTLLLLLAACAPPRAAAPSAAPSPTGPVEVRVSLAEYSIASSLTTFVAGRPYHFVVANDGTMPHEILVLAPMPTGRLTPEAMRAQALGFIEQRNLPAGGRYVMDVTFDRAYPAGSLELACHILGHYELGQHLPIVVTAR